jgi:hypothetical protein
MQLVRFVVDRVALGQVFLRVVGFPCRFHSTGAPLIVKICKKTAHPDHLHWGFTKSLKVVVRGPFIKKKSCNWHVGFISGDPHFDSLQYRGIVCGAIHVTGGLNLTHADIFLRRKR